MADKPTPLIEWLPRRAEQATIALLVVVGLAATAGWWVVRGGLGGRMLEVERVDARQAAYRVDVNAAAWPELAQLPGVGEAIARRIVESRRTEGPFRRASDLRRVRGIGPLTLRRLEPYLLPMVDSDGVAAIK